jgi:hypothetical protein
LAELLKGERPIRNLVGRLLWQTGLCRRFTIRKNGYVLRFFPSSVSCAYWIDPDARADDERIVTRLLDPGGTYVDVGAMSGRWPLRRRRRSGHREGSTRWRRTRPSPVSCKRT